MKNGFIKVAAARPQVSIADCRANVKEMKEIFSAASEKGVKVLVYPELSITGYTCADLFYSDTMLSS
ncbi:MAG: NAD(+) synthase, partial [Clostridia bacterium]|nr:NAD(+) synthase [Clostridia bacterium]